MARTQSGQKSAARTAARIKKCIAEGCELSVEIAQRMNVARETVDTCLRKLEISGDVHRICITPEGGKRYNNFWRLGPGVEDSETHCVRRGDRAIIRLVSTYPVVGVRDPLVAALFGAPGIKLQAPKQSAPRCTACGIEQGAGHAVNCIVQLVAA